MIVCNGMPFIARQLEHIYDMVDDIVIVEGPDPRFAKVIGARRSTDGTIKAIKEFKKNQDPSNKIILKHANTNKNEMVIIGNKLCKGDLIYEVDVDEFIHKDLIDEAFGKLEKVHNVKVPQRWYYKWTDTYLSSGREYSIRNNPTRFFRNRIDDGLFISHIPWHGYLDKNRKHKHCGKASTLPWDKYSYHLLAIFHEQLRMKMEFYAIRDGVSRRKVNARMKEFTDTKRAQVGHRRIDSYNAQLRLEKNPFPLKKVKGGLVWAK
jgi:glycosyltransferase involved in cell wall biosynthesis